MAGVCLVVGGRGHLGSPGVTATGDGSLVSTTIDTYANFLTAGEPAPPEEDLSSPPTQSFTFSVSPVSGETATSVVSRLITQINTNPNFIATMIGVGTTTFEVTRTGGGDVFHLALNETDSGFPEAGVTFLSPGRGWVAINRVVSINSNGTYRLIIGVNSGTGYDQTFNTAAAPTNTVAGLNTALDASLAQAGFCTAIDNASGMKYIQKAGTKILSTTLSATDTAISSFTIDITDTPPVAPVGSCSSGIGSSGVPTLSEVGLLVLVALLTGAALLVLRRKGIRRAV